MAPFERRHGSSRLRRILALSIAKDDKAAEKAARSYPIKPRSARKEFWDSSDLETTWLQLLRTLHDARVLYWPLECSGPCLASRRGQFPTTSFRPAPQSDITRSDAIVSMRKCTWDFMPADLLKPLATSTIRDVVILAMRLGMSWRTLEPGRAILVADGGRFGLQPLENRGLGILIAFYAMTSNLPELENNPSVSAAKLLFGIIPGDAELVGRGYYQVRDDGSIDHGPSFEILSSLGFAKSFKASIWSLNADKIHHEVVTLLCSFIQSGNSSFCRTRTVAFRPGRASIFHWWEGRYGLFRTLRDIHSRPEPMLDTAQKLYGFLCYLREQHPCDFFDHSWGATSIEAGGSWRHRELMQRWRSEFDDTSE